MEKIEVLDKIIADTLLDIPLTFEANGCKFKVYHPTFGQVLMTKRMLDAAGFDFDKFQANPIVEAIRVCEEDQKNILRAVAVNLMRKKDDIVDVSKLDMYINSIKGNISKQDLPTLLVMIMTRDGKVIDSVIRGTSLQRDRDNMQRIQAVKQNKNSFMFGRRTVYGQLIDSACARYGWSMEYVLWGISYVNLQLMMADQEVSIYLSDQERKEAHVCNDRDVINADDPANMERIKQLFND